mmetsp:Transcript_36340/g.119736  ORF Transcript_36340/g.119736 Transcript_36340/m.119736 type:complete len:236 (-) Transcript_36340:401-1108(-)
MRREATRLARTESGSTTATRWSAAPAPSPGSSRQPGPHAPTLAVMPSRGRARASRHTRRDSTACAAASTLASTSASASPRPSSARASARMRPMRSSELLLTAPSEYSSSSSPRPAQRESTARGTSPASAERAPASTAPRSCVASSLSSWPTASRSPLPSPRSTSPFTRTSGSSGKPNAGDSSCCVSPPASRSKASSTPRPASAPLAARFRFLPFGLWLFCSSAAASASRSAPSGR